MAGQNKTLILMASKLGLSEEPKVIRKALEYERLLQTRLNAGSIMSDTSKVLICLDLAATMFGRHVDLKTVAKYSGMKSSVYTNCRNTVENLLEIKSERLSTSLVSAQAQCTSVQPLADKILHKYQSIAIQEIDLSIPQYVCMAVYQACRMSKVKVSKQKLVEKSRLKPSQWTKLDADWTKFVNHHFQKKKQKPNVECSMAVDDYLESTENVSEKHDIASAPVFEEYEVWKQRILKAAFKELRDLEMQDQKRTPLKSPRKRNITPRKVASPYKGSTNRPGEVRLLFPM